MRKLVGALVFALIPTVASAAVLQPWQQWGGSASTTNLVIVPGTGDFTGDGLVDIAVYKPSTRQFWIGRSTGSAFSFCAAGGSACIGTNTEAWATLPTGCAQGFQFYTGQFGGDARMDVVVYNPCVGDLRVLVNNGTGGLTGPFATVDPLAGWKLIAGNFTGDSLTDVVVYYEGDGSIFVGRNAIFGFVWTQWGSVEPDPIGSGAPAWQFYPGDFNGDGLLDIFGYRPGTDFVPWGTNARVGTNTGSSFSMVSWSSLPPDHQTPVVARWTGTPTADVGLRIDGMAPGFGETNPDFRMMRNNNGSFYASENWSNLLPEDALWSLDSGDFVPTGTSAGLPEFFAYYPGDGSFWVAENRGLSPEGYAWPLSASPGETINFYFSGTLASTANNVLFRRVTANGTGTIIEEATPTASLTRPSTYQSLRGPLSLPKNGPQWAPSFSFQIPTGWPTGYYVATLKAQNGVDYRITFVVKPPANARHRTAILANINTWNAYNPWGGEIGVPGFKYAGAVQTTFMRPNPAATLFVGSAVPPTLTGNPDGQHLANAEVWALAGLESISTVGRGNIDVYTDLDFQDGQIVAGTGAGQYDKLIIGTHPEYWTEQMYDKLQTFLQQGGDVIYVGGNGIFERAMYSTAPLGGTTLSFFDGISGGDGSEAYRKPYLFRVRDQSNGSPLRGERKLLGVATTLCLSTGTDNPAPFVVKPHPPGGTYERTIFNAVFQGVVSQNDSNRNIGTSGVLGGASGHEMDKLATKDASGWVTNQIQCGFQSTGITERDTTPAGMVWLASGSNPGGGADMTFYRVPNKGFVFSAGSINFGQSLILDQRLKDTMKNVLGMN